jgi:hypothetical protein
MAAAAGEQLAHPAGVVDRADGGRARQRAGSCSGGQRQASVLDPLASVELDCVACRIDPRDDGGEAQIDLHVLPLGIGVHRDLVRRLLATQELLGEGRTVVGGVRLLADDRDRSLAAGLAELLGDHSAGQPAPNDQVVVPRHSSLQS